MQPKPSFKTEKPQIQIEKMVKNKSDAVTKFFKNEKTWEDIHAK